MISGASESAKVDPLDLVMFFVILPILIYQSCKKGTPTNSALDQSLSILGTGIPTLWISPPIDITKYLISPYTK